MAAQLPQIIDLRHLKDDAREITGEIPPQQLTRFVHPYFPVGAVNVALRVDDRYQRGVGLRGRLDTVVGAQCQRCLNDMRLPLGRDIDVLLLSGEDTGENEDDPTDVDEVEVIDGQFRVVDFVEDEVILACPMIPMHDDETCTAAQPGREPAEPLEERRRPFANLAQLLADENK